jgi:hypothetical protein
MDSEAPGIEVDEASDDARSTALSIDEVLLSDVRENLHLARLRRELRSQRASRLMSIHGNTIHPDPMAVPCSVVFRTASYRNFAPPDKTPRARAENRNA